MERPILETKNLEVSYDKTKILQDISLSAKQGEILGIVGESGSGKSTFLRAVMGLLGNGGQITGGSIRYKDQELHTLGGEALRRLRGPQIGMVFQNTQSSLCPVRTIESQLCEAVLQHEEVSREEIRSRALELFEKIGLSDGDRILKSYPFELSGGMNQRVGIMMAMILKPTILLADEPTSALDVRVQAQVVKEMMKMREIYGTTIILVTHHIGVVEKMADKVAVMYQGRLVEYGSTQEVIYNPAQEYTKKLTGAVLRIHRG